MIKFADREKIQTINFEDKMTQILVTLENGADSGLIQRIIDNIKGVFHTSVETVSVTKNSTKQDNDWIRQIKELSNSFDTNLLDKEDDRVRYLLNK